jgi:guanylate kinase
MVSTIQQAADFQADYRPNPAITTQLHEKSMVMLVAPAASGKTHLMEYATRLDNRFQPVVDFTTRDPRLDDDPRLFRYIPHDDKHINKILAKINRRELVQYVVHPSGQFYGTEIHDFPSTYNMLATLSFAVNQLQSLPFKQTFVLGIIAEPQTWHRWFNIKFPPSHPEREKRIKEAIASLTWLLEQPEGSIYWIINKEGAAEQAAQSILDAVLYNKKSDARKIAEAVRTKAKEMLYE